MTLNLSIDEFIKNKSKKHARQKKLNIDEKNYFFLMKKKTYTLMSKPSAATKELAYPGGCLRFKTQKCETHTRHIPFQSRNF